MPARKVRLGAQGSQGSLKATLARKVRLAHRVCKALKATLARKVWLEH